MPNHDLYQISLKVILKNKAGEILLLKSNEDGSYAGFYDFPGGRISIDEFSVSFEDVVKREVEEEIGNIDYKLNSKPVAIGRYLLPAKFNHSGKDIHVLYIFFEAQYESGDIKISDEHEDHLWLNLSNQPLDKFFKSGILDGIKMYLGK
ncbi:MAG TPA: NUDIX domain-containing protein [Patescibacteria group bacterium]|nr:NUDIX domain-containing protein [Patescibacteria group bacterium]